MNPEPNLDALFRAARADDDAEKEDQKNTETTPQTLHRRPPVTNDTNV